MRTYDLAVITTSNVIWLPAAVFSSSDSRRPGQGELVVIVYRLTRPESDHAGQTDRPDLVA